MSEQRLNITNIPLSSSERLTEGSRKTQFRELQAKFERLWLIHPEMFDPLRNCMERERMERTWELLVKHDSVEEKKAVDIGCGAGNFSRRLRDAKAHVEGVDIAENALKCFREVGADHILLKRETMPVTNLGDHAYDLIVCTEVIAELPPADYRLFFAELARIIKPDGYLLCSSSIDIYSVGGLDKFIELAQTEFDILDGTASYHALYLRILSALEVPSSFTKARENIEYRKNELSIRNGFSRIWFWLNTTPLFIWIWYVCNFFTQPLRKILKNQQRVMLFLERVCRFFWDKEGISHYIFIAKRRQLMKLNPEEIPIEKPKRKEVWD